MGLRTIVKARLPMLMGHAALALHPTNLWQQGS